jgi:HD-like signal output (HDOD) protein/CheY-like chemotaxis protein
MINIIFVDDEAKILDGLRRSMYCMRGEWKMRFECTGSAALQALANEPADVIVSDMRMPDMDGSQLMLEVMRLYPGVVRIILSGQAEQESLVRATRTTHRYLSKPCDAATLKSNIQRTMILRDLLTRDRLAAVVGSVDALPSAPKTYQQLVACLRNPDAPTGQLVGIIRHDVAMTAKVLKLANSGFFGLRQPVQTVERAVSFIGADAIATLVLGEELFEMKAPISLPEFSLDQLSRHSFTTAAWARAIALHEHLPANIVDAAFLTGVLHDLGRLVFATRMPPNQLAQRTHWEMETKSQMDAFHPEVGGYLLGLWGFPDAIVEAIVWHHTPSRCMDTGLGLCGILHISDCLAHEREDTAPGVTPRLEAGYLESLHLADHWPDWQDLLAVEVA